MSIQFEILGNAGRDNALFLRIDTGQSVERLLFDCGEACVLQLDFAEVQSIDRLFFSHLHMDHIGGFDAYFRATFNRETKPNLIYGPPSTAQILQHRFRGFLWNLHHEMRGTWRVSDVFTNRLETHRFELSEAFVTDHAEMPQPFTRHIVDHEHFTVEPLTLDHNTVSLGYIVREKPRSNIDTARLQALGLRPGPWLKELKMADARESIHIHGVQHSAAEMRAALVVESAGDSIAYLTDFLPDATVQEDLIQKLHGCKVLVCDSQYRHADVDLARKHRHMTSTLTAQLAQSASVQELVLFHLSERYTPDVWLEMLNEARAIFPGTRFPLHWTFEG